MTSGRITKERIRRTGSGRRTFPAWMSVRLMSSAMPNSSDDALTRRNCLIREWLSVTAIGMAPTNEGQTN